MLREENCLGARIERGEIVEVSGDEYRVKSLDRDGVVTPPLRSLICPELAELFDVTASATGQYPCSVTVTLKCDPKLQVGDRVCFFLFEDGYGLILSKIRWEVS